MNTDTGKEILFISMTAAETYLDIDMRYVNITQIIIPDLRFL